jgi:isopenicillin N synthase-like dioxygenase
MIDATKQKIPVVDLADVSPEALREAFGRYGLVYVRSHDIAPSEVDAFYDSFARFTRRPEEHKRTLGRADLWYQRGWTPPNTEKAVVAGGQPDFKECYFVAPTELDPKARLHYPQIYADNIWPESDDGFDAAEFRERYLALGRKLHAAGEALLRGCAVALDLPADTFTKMIAGGPHVTRVLHYLALRPDQIDTGVLWGEEHTDFNLLTMLPGGRFYDPAGRPSPRPDNKSGLWLRTRPTAEAPRGELVQGRPPEGCIIAQVGQMLEILTGGAFLATPHVVTAPGTPGYSRMSSAHFIHLHSNQLLFPLDKFQTTESLAAYSPPVLAGTYSMKTLVDIGLAPPSALDRLGYRHYDRLGTIRAQEITEATAREGLG